MEKGKKRQEPTSVQTPFSFIPSKSEEDLTKNK